MSTPRIPAPGLLFLSALCACWEQIWPELFPLLGKLFGPLAWEEGPLPFTQTGYYDAELGAPITRRLMAFEELVPLDRLAWAKLETNELEHRFSKPKGGRLVNLDPGLLTLERLVLATGKNYTHRVYLNHGIWADLTLIYQFGSWRVLPWTFPDYAAPDMQQRLSLLRTMYKQRLDEHAETMHTPTKQE